MNAYTSQTFSSLSCFFFKFVWIYLAFRFLVRRTRCKSHAKWWIFFYSIFAMESSITHFWHFKRPWHQRPFFPPFFLNITKKPNENHILMEFFFITLEFIWAKFVKWNKHDRLKKHKSNERACLSMGEMALRLMAPNKQQQQKTELIKCWLKWNGDSL